MKEHNYKVFKSVLEHRNPHHHAGKKFYDGELIKSQNATWDYNMFKKGDFLEFKEEYRENEMNKIKKDEEKYF